MERHSTTLWMRYLFFGWMFRDASRGNALERAAAWRHNREQACWLGAYLRRWLTLGVLLYAAGCGLESGLDSVLTSVPFYVSAALTVSVDAVIVAAYAGLRLLPAPTQTR